MRKKELLDEIELLKKRVQDLESRLVLQEIKSIPFQPYIPTIYPTLNPPWWKDMRYGPIQPSLPGDYKIICMSDTGGGSV